MGGDGKYPTWFQNEFIRLARPPISRIIKKANIQLRETKKYFNIKAPKGIFLFVNDGFTGLAPSIVNAIACNLLVHSYYSVDCFIYLNVNRYIEISGSNEPKLIWQPSYSVRENDDLVGFVDDLGQRWFDFLEQEIGQFTSRIETPSRAVVQNSRAIILPHENRG